MAIKQLLAAVLSAGLLAMSRSAPVDSHDQGFFIDPAMPDGQYSIDLAANGNHLVRRWSESGQRWQKLRKREGTTETTFLVDDHLQEVKAVSYDQYAPQRLPFPEAETHCLHYRDYNTLNYPLIQADYYASKRALFNWCSLFPIVDGHVALALDGNVAVYVCQRRKTGLSTNYCSEGEFKAAEARINATCGLSSGYTFIRDWNKEYGRAWRGERTCRRWGQMKGLLHVGPVTFNDRPGNGKMTKEPKGLRDPRPPQELLNATLFEQERPEYMSDDGIRRNHRSHYGEFTGGWYHLWMTLTLKWDKKTGKLKPGLQKTYNNKKEHSHDLESHNDTRQRLHRDPPAQDLWTDTSENLWDGGKKKKIKFDG
ncbi:hypothetical protein CDD81_1518 [Ophiocordyceps australis]|uniref:Uncharacterized protein n=1 Tax=Ophiocordyceps australis TaxID=1399860 RepID=A0A2C5YG01_9HYPO|nr:hypothetical protein CDD81_1518 [Ophiocordyceps australis]